MSVKNSFCITRYRSQVTGTVSLTCSFPTHCYSCSPLMVLDCYYSLSIKIPAPLRLCILAMSSLWLCLSSLLVTSQSLKNSYSFHLCFAAPFHSHGHANVCYLILIKTATSGCDLCMLSYLLSLLLFFLSLRGILWPLCCLPVSIPGSSIS